jgi:rod shape-determining protein MreD
MSGAVLRDALRAGLALLIAFLAYSFLGSLGLSALVVLNAFSLVVMLFANGRDEIFGAALGAICGLVQDSFSLGVFGVAGLSKTLLGFWTGYISRRVDVASFFRSAAFLFVMAAAELFLWVIMNAIAHQERPDLHGGLLLLQPIVTALLGSALLTIRRRIAARRS